MEASPTFRLGVLRDRARRSCRLDGSQAFNEINNILAGLVGQVESEINKVSPWINFLDHIDPKADIAIVNFSVDKARECAYLATKLAPLNKSQWKPQIELRDLEMTALAKLLQRPAGSIINLGLLLIRSLERNDVATVIDVLTRTPAAQV